MNKKSDICMQIANGFRIFISSHYIILGTANYQ